jgi:hypothetical protein
MSDASSDLARQRAIDLRSLATWEDNVANGAEELLRKRADLAHLEACYLQDIAKRDALRDKVFGGHLRFGSAALSTPSLQGKEGVGLPAHQQSGAGGQESIGQQDKAEQWFWYASGDEENYSVGPCASREEAIEVALQDETGISPDLKRQCFVVIRATQKPLNLSRMIDVDSMLDSHMDGIFYDAAGPEHDPAELIDHIKQEQWNELEQRLRATTDAWQAERGIVVTPRVFNESTNPESVQCLYINEAHVLAHAWSKAPEKFIHENVFVADGDTYISVAGQWYGPTPEGISFGPAVMPGEFEAKDFIEPRSSDEGNETPSDGEAVNEKQNQSPPQPADLNLETAESVPVRVAAVGGDHDELGELVRMQRAQARLDRRQSGARRLDDDLPFGLMLDLSFPPID